MTAHRPLARSSVLVAMAGAALPLGIANADTTFYATDGSFATAAGAAGLTQRYVETFEEHDGATAYAMLASPLTSGVPNGVFSTGLDAPDLTVRAMDSSNLFMLVPNAAYWPNITSSCVGTNSSSDRVILEFSGDGAMAVGLTVTGLSSFTSNYPQEVEYEIRNAAGDLVATGAWPTPTSDVGAFMGVVSTEPMASIELRGMRFGLDQQEYVDDVQAWIDDDPPAPGDATGDGLTNVDDIVAVVLAWGDCPGCPEDLDGDNVVGIDDILEVILNWNP